MVNFQFDASYPTFRISLRNLISRDFEVNRTHLNGLWYTVRLQFSWRARTPVKLIYIGPVFIRFTGFYIIGIMLEISETFDINEHGVSGWRVGSIIVLRILLLLLWIQSFWSEKSQSNQIVGFTHFSNKFEKNWICEFRVSHQTFLQKVGKWTKWGHKTSEFLTQLMTNNLQIWWDRRNSSRLLG